MRRNTKNSKIKYLTILIMLFGASIIVKAVFIKDDRLLNTGDEKKNITLDDEGIIIRLKTNSATVADFLNSQKINLNDKDYIFPDKNSSIQNGAIVKVWRAKNIIISIDKEKKELLGFGSTIGEIIAENNLNLKEEDLVNPKRETIAYNNEEVKITRVEIKEEIIKKPIAFKTITNQDNELGWRVKKITQKGIKGIEEMKYEVAYHDKKEVSRKIKETTITQEPVEEIITQGTYIKLGATHTGGATWYDQSTHPNLMARYPFEGNMFAANPWLPLGSYAKVTNKANGKSIIVRINDRGPFGGGRILDLNKVAFAKIASLGAGVTDIKLEEIKN